MKLYHHPLSPNGRRVLLTAAYLGIPLESQVVDITKGEQNAPDYLALNPNGMIPTLIDGDQTVWESRAIVQYLASKKPESGLLGKGEMDRINIARWQCWDAAHVMANIFTLVFETVLKAMLGMGAPDQNAIRGAREQLKRFCGAMDASLKGKQYLVGDSLTVADLTVAASFTYADALKLPIDQFPNVKSWFDRITSLDAWKKTQPKM